MNTTKEMSDLKDMLDDPAEEVARSVFRDTHQFWAKEWKDVHDVYVQFEIGRIFVLTPDEFKTLTKSQQDKIRHAPSMPLPE